MFFAFRLEAFSRAAAHAGAAGSEHISPGPPPPLQDGSVGLVPATKTLIVSVLKTPFTDPPGPRSPSVIVIIAVSSQMAGKRVMVTSWLLASPQPVKFRVGGFTVATDVLLLVTDAMTNLAS